jgi:hypothetical protein
MYFLPYPFLLPWIRGEPAFFDPFLLPEQLADAPQQEKTPIQRIMRMELQKKMIFLMVPTICSYLIIDV